jgi:thiol:disulfide interchange protein DsbD
MKNVTILIAALLSFGAIASRDNQDIMNHDLKFSEGVLKADQAYQFTSEVKGPVTRLFWRIAPGYNLYKHKITLTNNAKALSMPKGVLKMDGYYGQVELLSGDVIIDVDTSQVKDGSFTVNYQGCKLNIICYPPQRKVITLN